MCERESVCVRERVYLHMSVRERESVFVCVYACKRVYVGE